MPNNLVKKFHQAFATLAAAARTASAVDNGNAARSDDLKTLGIDPVAFKSIRR